jgi:hypothetical protein
MKNFFFLKNFKKDDFLRSFYFLIEKMMIQENY